jgi:phenylacetate-CoA ligase
MDIRITELLAERRRLRVREHWTRKALEDYQAQAVRLVREYAYTHSPFYQQFHQGLYDAPLQDLPVLTKDMVMDDFDDLMTDRAIHLQDVRAYMSTQRADRRFLGRYWIHASSGSSGHPGVFLVNRAEWTTMMAAASRLSEWVGTKMTPMHRVKVAIIASTTPFHPSAQPVSTFQRLVVPQIQLAASEKISTIVERLNAWQPELLASYPSMMRILADEQLAGHLKIAPRSVLCSAEALTPETHRRIVKAWGKVLFNGYATAECSLGAECDQHRGMHL